MVATVASKPKTGLGAIFLLIFKAGEKVEHQKGG